MGTRRGRRERRWYRRSCLNWVSVEPGLRSKTNNNDNDNNNSNLYSGLIHHHTSTRILSLNCVFVWWLWLNYMSISIYEVVSFALSSVFLFFFYFYYQFLFKKLHLKSHNNLEKLLVPQQMIQLARCEYFGSLQKIYFSSKNFK